MDGELVEPPEPEDAAASEAAPAPPAPIEGGLLEAPAADVDEPAHPPRIPIPPVVDVHDLPWDDIVASLHVGAHRARMRATVEQLEDRLDGEGGLPLLFDEHRATADDRALQVVSLTDDPLWFIGDIHGDLLALDAALALIDREAVREQARPRIVLLGDLFDDGGYELELSLIHISEPTRPY